MNKIRHRQINVFFCPTLGIHVLLQGPSGKIHLRDVSRKRIDQLADLCQELHKQGQGEIGVYDSGWSYHEGTIT